MSFHPAQRAINWWLEPTQQRTHSRLGKMAIDVLSAPAMSAESERVFSMARRTVTFDRTSLNSEVIEHTKCHKSWVKQGLVDEDYGSSSDEEEPPEGNARLSTPFE